MKILNYKPEGYLPGIILDREAGKFEISGKACPEDAIEFYDPVFNWIEEYSNDPLDKMVFDFKLTYYNTVTSKILMMIMMRLEEVAEKGNYVKIRWYYPEDDEDMEEAGEDYAGMLEIDFEMIEYNSDETDNDNSPNSLIDSIL